MAGSTFIPILYEDNHVLGVSKPVNIPTQEDASGDPDMLSLLKEDIKIRFEKPGNVYLGLVHRLDRPVGGSMIFAKTSKAASRLSDQVRTRTLDKVYYAVVHGTPPKPAEFGLKHYLLKDERSNTVTSVGKSTPGAKEAVLDYRTLGTTGKYSLVKIKLHTGRSHQIRVQMASLNCPLYGDQKYGANENKPGQQIALWSVCLSFDHPVSKERITVTSLPPEQTEPWRLWERDLLELHAHSHL
ncbi:RluA family pseudouridine synthase [Paenibacillus gansuensis]|uniref:RNA pseudouridylate synthase n=1 Tax=Paenibacillus gansuensis TaxID=306542 RepID=A0ABW5PAV7_9BACL